MRIVILTIGSRGDVQPYVALGLGLQHAGFDVRIATHEHFAGLVQRYGLGYATVAGDPRSILSSEMGQAWLESGTNAVAFMRRMMVASGGLLWQVANDYLQACRDVDIVMAVPLTVLIALSIAEKYKLRLIPAYLQHVHPNSTYPSAMIAPAPRLGSLYNRLSYPIGSQLFWQLMRPQVNGWRRNVLGLRPYPFGGPYEEIMRRRTLTLYGFSKCVLPRVPEWGDEVCITGYWLLPTEPNWQPPARLAEFLASGSPPVFIGFGSMTLRDPVAVTRTVVEALGRAGQRGVLLRGWAGLDPSDLPPSVLAIDEAPYDWLLPRMAAVVHHGGAGTTGAALRAGVPSIVCPFFGDQPFWAWRVQAIGAGPRPLPQKQLTAERLAATIREAVENPALRDRAAEIGRCIRAEDGVANAVAAVRGIAPAAT